MGKLFKWLASLARRNEKEPYATPREQTRRAPAAQQTWQQGQTTTRYHSIPSMKELLYPEELQTFEKLAEDNHRDQRALIYTISNLNPERKRPFSDGDISYLDFGKKSTAYSALKKAKLIEPLEPGAELEARLTKVELDELAQERGLKTTGRKRAVADRLAKSGYKIDRRKHRGRLFRLTEFGAGAVTACRDDRRAAVLRAMTALKEFDYREAIAAYREFDRKWGFAHTSGKLHTIFANYDYPYSRFRFIENYPMYELRNTEDFKTTLRACLLAGLMRGCQDQWDLTCAFKEACKEEINCPRLLSLFEYEPEVLENMRQQIEFSSDNALEYYISHLLYLSRQ